jgi:hypothetical protein
MINPYDYAKGLGITRGNVVAKLVFTFAKVPVVGETAMRRRNADDWSLPVGRRRTVAAVPGARVETMPDGAHFLPLD